MKLTKVCFHRCLSFHRGLSLCFQGGGSVSKRVCVQEVCVGGGGGGLCPGCLCLGVSVSRGSLSTGVSVQGVSVQGGFLSRDLYPGDLYPGGICPGGLCPGGLCPGGLCPGWSLSKGLGGLCHGDPMYSNERAVRIQMECILVWPMI